MALYTRKKAQIFGRHVPDREENEQAGRINDGRNALIILGHPGIQGFFGAYPGRQIRVQNFSHSSIHRAFPRFLGVVCLATNRLLTSIP